jgi:GNAT superfamily N-acetyltransferase
MADRAFLESLSHRSIGADIDTSVFRCDENIDWYLREVALDHHNRGITSVFCWLLGNTLVGYATTSMNILDMKDYPATERECRGLADILQIKGGKLCKRFPALLIGMLGVSIDHRRKGLGDEMVSFAIGQARSTSADVACRFVTVDATDTEAATLLYEKNGFVRAHGQNNRGKVAMYYDLGPRVSPSPPL